MGASEGILRLAGAPLQRAEDGTPAGSRTLTSTFVASHAICYTTGVSRRDCRFQIADCGLRTRARSVMRSPKSPIRNGFGVPGRSRAFPSRFGDGYAVCYTTGTNRMLVGDPRLALSLFLFPKQVGRCLPMSPLVRLRGLEPPCLSASGPQPDVSARFHHSRVPGEGIAPPSPRCERGILLLEEPDEEASGRKHEDIVAPPWGARGCMMLLGCGTPSCTELACL